MLCYVCRGSDFYDDQQGSLICSLCGTASQEYLQESHDLEDEVIPSQGKLQYRTVVSGVGKGGASRKRQQPISRSHELVLVDILTAYQYILIKMMQATLHLYHIYQEYDIDLMMTDLKLLWTKYLQRLRQENVDLMDYFNNYETQAMNSTIFPSINLLVGIIYYICRYYRFGLDLAMICRWCEQDLLPYSNPWDILPEAIKANIPIQYQSFFTRFYLSNDLTPMILLSYLSQFAYFLGITSFPPLNAPLIAWQYIEALGLPEEVWNNYIQISKTMTATEPIDGFQSFGEEYGENIIALIIIACKLCTNWMYWPLLRSSSNFSSSLPVTLHELDRMPRLMLPALLQQMQGLLKKRSFHTEAFSYNRSICKLLASISENDWIALHDPNMDSPDADVMVDETTLHRAVETYSLSISICPFLLLADHHYINPSTIKRNPWKGFYRHLHGIVVFKRIRKRRKRRSTRRRRRLRYKPIIKVEDQSFDNPRVNTGNPSLISCSNYAYDDLGICQPAYMILVERCAKLIDCSPSLLHHLVDQVLEPKIHNVVQGRSAESKGSSIEGFQAYTFHHQIFESIATAQNTPQQQVSNEEVKLGRGHLWNAMIEGRLGNVASKLSYQWNQRRLNEHISLSLLSEIGLQSEFNGHEVDEDDNAGRKIPAFTDKIYREHENQPVATISADKDDDDAHSAESEDSSSPSSSSEEGDGNDAHLLQSRPVEVEEPFIDIFSTIRRRNQPTRATSSSSTEHRALNYRVVSKSNLEVGEPKLSDRPSLQPMNVDNPPSSHRLRQYLNQNINNFQ
jgi:hypothetical protein